MRSRALSRGNCASVLGNAHFNKGSGTDPLSLVMASAAFGNVARAALGFARDTDAEDDSCVISQVKNNLGRLDLPSLRYKIDGVFIDTDEGPAEVGMLVWLGESERSVSDLLRDTKRRSEREVADDWLCGVDGQGPRHGRLRLPTVPMGHPGLRPWAKRIVATITTSPQPAPQPSTCAAVDPFDLAANPSAYCA